MYSLLASDRELMWREVFHYLCSSTQSLSAVCTSATLSRVTVCIHRQVKDRRSDRENTLLCRAAPTFPRKPMERMSFLKAQQTFLQLRSCFTASLRASRFFTVSHKARDTDRDRDRERWTDTQGWFSAEPPETWEFRSLQLSDTQCSHSGKEYELRMRGGSGWWLHMIIFRWQIKDTRTDSACRW